MGQSLSNSTSRTAVIAKATGSAAPAKNSADFEAQTTRPEAEADAAPSDG